MKTLVNRFTHLSPQASRKGLVVYTHHIQKVSMSALVNTRLKKAFYLALVICTMASCFKAQTPKERPKTASDKIYTSLEQALKEPKNVFKLDLSNQKLSTLPASIGQLSNLTYLNLSTNSLSNLPKSFRKLQKLETLDVSNNQFTVIDETICDLKNLKALLVEHNHITTISKSIQHLKQLARFDLEDNKITQLPNSIGNLSCLLNFVLEKNSLTELPNSICKLSQLNSLNLSHNKLSNLPNCINNLTSLESLWLGYNKLSTLPVSMSTMDGLTSIWLHQNDFSSIPKAILNLPNLDISMEWELLAAVPRDSIPVVNEAKGLYNPFDSISYDSVIVYNLNYDTKTNKPVGREGRLQQLSKHRFHNLSSLKTVDDLTVNRLINAVSDTTTYGEQYADCFIPRLAFTFFENDKEVFSIFICFECGFLKSTITIPATRHAYYDIESFEYDYEKQKIIRTKPILVRRYLKGFSDHGYKTLLELCKELNMPYCTSN